MELLDLPETGDGKGPNCLRCAITHRASVLPVDVSGEVQHSVKQKPSSTAQ